MSPLAHAHFRPISSLATPLDRSTSLRPLQPRVEGLDALAHHLIGHWRRWRSPVEELTRQGRESLEACEALSTFTDDALRVRLGELRDSLRLDPAEGKGMLIQAIGCVGQMALRHLGLKPYPVQFMGALALHRGLLAEMATGEGKTLTVGLAGVLAGFSGRTCHIITANDYLAHRDAEEMTRLYHACGLSVSSVVSTMEQAERAIQYGSDVVYLTAKELLADYLRDEIGSGSREQRTQAAFMAWLNGVAGTEPPGRVLVRGVHTAIVDEADSILIDEAVTPLILSASRENRGLAEAVMIVSQLADTLVEGEDYSSNIPGKNVQLLPSGMERLTHFIRDIPVVWRPAQRREELLRQALFVRHFFKPGHHYVVQDGEVVLLDEFTGRMTPGRSLTAGLHQAIEAREGVTISTPKESLTQMSFQAFFSRFRKLSGCTGTAWEAAAELWRVYGLQVVRIPEHRRRQTIYRTPVITRSGSGKWQAILEEVLKEHRLGRPVLVGVRSVNASEMLAERLRNAGCEVRVLNALTHAEEAEIVSQAGQAGVITIATNMAGRGTDIRLGQGVVERGGLHVVVAEINESLRVDRQLAGRCGRQGDPGTVSIYLSLDDDLAVRLLPESFRSFISLLTGHSVRGLALAAQRAFRWAQSRLEAEAFARRWSVLKADEWMRSALPFEGQGRRTS
ncbi:hypothetical protein [Candidatus Magnetaquicoccus inordinatus]|uniref:preprotein translocase subunit SecA n=1 Tax=Candidatus Magnetaquicoccus inordinatus TaxID=2496818 RepID=UPI00102B37A9|nr:hypothetical protein [Candidatus Magnetaquicoccus inordinatus]